MMTTEQKENETKVIEKKKGHTRPKIRKRNHVPLASSCDSSSSHNNPTFNHDRNTQKPSSNTQVDELLEETLQKIDHALQLQEQRSTSSVGLLEGLLKNTMDTDTDSNTGIQILKNNTKSTVTASVPTIKIPAKKDEVEQLQETGKGSKVKGILKHESRYQSKKGQNMTNIGAKVSDMTHNTNQQKKVMENPTTKAFVKDTIIERQNPKPELYPKQMMQTMMEKEEEKQINQFNETAIEGHTPKNSDLKMKGKTQKIKHISFKNVNDNDVKDDNQDVEENNESDPNNIKTIETDMEFKIITESEYKSAVEVAHSLGMSVEDFISQQKDLMNQEEKGGSCANSTEHGNNDKQLINGIFNESDSNESDSNEEEEDDEDFFSFFGPDSDEESGEEEQGPSPFMILWNALSKWITPKSVELLQQYKSELFDKDHGEKYAPVVSNEIYTPESPLQDNDNPGTNSDITQSRCEGLMSMIKMNLSKAISDLGYNKNNGNRNRETNELIRQTSHIRLGEFIQSFDFSESMVKLDSKMWLALTVLLLDIVLPSKEQFDDDTRDATKDGSIARNDNQSPQKILLPSSIIAVDISLEEYLYLIQSAIPSLSKGSSGAL